MDEDLLSELMEEDNKAQEKGSKYVSDEKSRFKFLGKGGYSRVYLDKQKGNVLKLIKKEKMENMTSLNTLRDELVNGMYYRYTRTDLGTI